MQPKLKRISIVASCSDGKIRQVIIDKTIEDAILSLIIVMEKNIKLLEDPIEGIEIITQ